jgi:tetratricopeptide (TPR) repeat protein
MAQRRRNSESSRGPARGRHRRVGFGLAAAALLLSSLVSAAPEPTSVPEPTPTPEATPASGPTPEPGSWYRLDSPHFTVFSDAPNERAAGLAGHLELFRAALAQFHPGFAVRTIRPAYVYFFRSEKEYRPYKMRIGGQVIGPAGLYRPWDEADVMMLDAENEPAALERIHGGLAWSFLDQNPADLPPWFASGVADLYSTFKADGQEFTVGLPIDEYLQTLRRATLLPLSEMFFLDPSSPDRKPGTKYNLYTAESWALAQYLLVGGERRPQMMTWLDQLLAGAQPEPAFHAAMPVTDEALLDEVERYVHAGKMAVVTLRPGPGAGPPDAPKVVPIKRDEILARLGDVVAHLDQKRAEEAAGILAESLRLNPAQSLAHAALGYLSEEGGEDARAAAYYDKAVSLNPDDVAAGYRFAKYLLAHYEPPKIASASPPPNLIRARQLLQRVIRLQPEFAEAYVVNGESFLKTHEEPSPGIVLLEKARVMLPARSELLVDLVRLYVRKGDRERAEELTEKVLPIRGSPMQTWEARIWLGRYDAPAPGGDDPEARMLRERQAASTDPAEKRTIQERIDGMHKLFLVKKHTVIFNKAVDLANTRHYTEAADLLRKFLPEVVDPDLQARFRDLAGRLRQNAAQLQGQGAPARP